jgi:hypothetical protein
MNLLRTHAAVLLLATGLSTSLAFADDGKRYYDKAHKDYHTWNDDEQRNYTTFLNENHIRPHDFAKAKAAEQQRYWNWRHDHPDDKR